MEIGKIVGGTALDLVKNDNVLNKTAGVMGMLFPYAGLRQKAVNMYIEEIEKSDMTPEAKVFAFLNIKKTFKKIKNQKSIADIAIENAKEGTDFSEQSGVSEDWLDRFMDLAGFVSAEDIQLIWGKILANEFEKPGSTPPNMIRILSEITSDLASAFRKICSMRVFICPLLEDDNIEMAFEKTFVPYNGHEDVFHEMGISFNILNELETLGVIRFSTIGGYVSKKIENAKVLLCIGDKLEVISEHKNGEIPIGNVMLTSVGEALQRITEDEKIPNYYEMIREYVLKNSVKLADEHDFQIAIEGETWHISKKNLSSKPFEFSNNFNTNR